MFQIIKRVNKVRETRGKFGRRRLISLKLEEIEKNILIRASDTEKTSIFYLLKMMMIGIPFRKQKYMGYFWNYFTPKKDLV